jgi:NAD kinase
MTQKFEKVILVTKKTRLEELILRYGSERQARFHIEQGHKRSTIDKNSVGIFDDYVDEHQRYHASLDYLRPLLANYDDLKLQIIDRDLVKSFIFSSKDLIVTLGQDGLVANTAKYIGAQPLIAINPDPDRYDGILMPFVPEEIKQVLGQVIKNNYHSKSVTLAEAVFSDGQKMLAFNDFFIGVSGHSSARYTLEIARKKESHSSSGIIISTGAGSTGWLSSVINMANSIAQSCGGQMGVSQLLNWQDRKLVFAVREPFKSKTSSINTVFGYIDDENILTLESQMPTHGVVFSDGIEDDFIHFRAGTTVKVRPAKQQAILIAK